MGARAGLRGGLEVMAVGGLTAERQRVFPGDGEGSFQDPPLGIFRRPSANGTPGSYGVPVANVRTILVESAHVRQ